MKYTDKELLDYIVIFKQKNGRLPYHGDFINNPEYPGYSAYQRRFGSWSMAIEKSGFDISIENFWKNVDKKDVSECWNWKGSKTSDYYGQVYYKGSIIYVHRLSWILHNSNIPSDMLVLHKCNNSLCCNPKHLYIGTHIDNMNDMKKAGSTKGENNSQAKLNWDIVNQLRGEYINDKTVTTRILSKKYNIPLGTIKHIISGRHWTDDNYKPPLKSRNGGENSGRTKLTWKDVDNIRKDYKSGMATYKLAEKFNASYNTIWFIVKNKSWYNENYQRWIEGGGD